MKRKRRRSVPLHRKALRNKFHLNKANFNRRRCLALIKDTMLRLHHRHSLPEEGQPKFPIASLSRSMGKIGTPTWIG